MSSIVSRRPSCMNQWKDAFWMSIRLGRSRTCFRREKLLRARGAATPLLNYEASLGNGLRMFGELQAYVDGRTGQLTEYGQACARADLSPRRSASSIAEVPRVARRRGLCFCEQSDTVAGRHGLGSRKNGGGGPPIVASSRRSVFCGNVGQSRPPLVP